LIRDRVNMRAPELSKPPRDPLSACGNWTSNAVGMPLEMQWGFPCAFMVTEPHDGDSKTILLGIGLI
jgi:hypothetical protein